MGRWAPTMTQRIKWLVYDSAIDSFVYQTNKNCSEYLHTASYFLTSRRKLCGIFLRFMHIRKFWFTCKDLNISVSLQEAGILTSLN